MGNAVVDLTLPLFYARFMVKKAEENKHD